MRRDWAAAAQTKSRAESSGRGLVVVEVLGGGSCVEQRGVGGWAQHQGTGSGTSSVFLKDRSAWAGQDGGEEGEGVWWRRPPGGPRNMPEKGGVADGG